MSLIVLPTAIVISTPLNCNYCQTINNTHLCGDHTNTLPDPKLNWKWVTKECTLNGSVSPFMLYFPYILLLMAFTLFILEKFFKKSFKNSSKLENLYTIYMNIKSQTDPREEGHGNDIQRKLIEATENLKNSGTFFRSYVFKTILELAVSTFFITIIFLFLLPSLQEEDTIYCRLHSKFWYECAGHPRQFYLIILYITTTITSAYISCNLYNLVWLVTPSLGSLSSFMSNYSRIMKAEDESQCSTVVNVYYDNRDLRLLLDFFSISSGIAPALAILAAVDQDYLLALKPSILSVSQTDSRVKLSFQAPNSIEYKSLTKMPKIDVKIIAEMVSSTEDNFDLLSDDGNDAIDIDITSDQIFYKTFPVIKNRTYNLLVSLVINGEVVSQDKKIVKTDK
eukprot:GFUD01032340.1.p1 GENE.GFUD01032340.1~~GFUD01032340.1.p1  ORF type:complete len:421 (-),score=105.96 GFUD01032340.1:18-1202(-)